MKVTYDKLLLKILKKDQCFSLENIRFKKFETLRTY